MAIDPAGLGDASLPTHGTEGVADQEHAALAADLAAAVAGDVRFDEYAQVLYATDGSIYGARPAGVVIPEDEGDVVAAVEIAADHDAPVLPRGAGSSLAGQTVGPGCVVLDCSKHLNDIREIDTETQRAVVQPGVVQDDLDAALVQHGLKFAPDPASSNRATLGGGIGNNSTGAHSVRYGITVDYVESVRAVLADGTVATFEEIVVGSPEWDEMLAEGGHVADLHRAVRDIVEENEAEIAARYPDLQRNVSGYSLDAVADETEQGDRTLNLAKLLVGAEGTLGVVVAAEVSLVTVPEETALALYCYEDLGDAMRAVPTALEHDASAVELMDDEVFRLARGSPEYAEYAEPIPESAGAALMLEFDSELHDNLVAAVDAADSTFRRAGNAFDTLHAFDDDSQRNLWKLRKAAIPLLMSMEGDAKPYPFIEDATVPPEELAAYVEQFEAVLAAHDTSAAYFAHAGAGTLHIRPVLSLKETEGIETMRSIASDVTDLVAERGGSFSGEHGDGLARTQFNPKMYGPQLWDAFKHLKTAFDPEWRMNPGAVVFRDDEPTEMTEHLRYGADYASLEPTTALDFEDEGGFSHLVELCNGCGTCRTTQSDVMCPTYRASGEELATTRGRANLLRAAISGDLPEDELYADRFHEAVLDLCVGCKGCQSDCPTGVDMAKLKAELKHQRHEREGASLRDRLFADIDRLAAWGSRLAPVSNWLTSIPGSGAVAERLLSITAERPVPSFASESFDSWFTKREATVDAADAAERVAFLPDTHTNYIYPEVGKAAVMVLEAADCHVVVPDETGPAGRAAVSGGFLDLATERARVNVDALAPMVDDGWSVVTAEPSDAAVVQDEYTDLVDGDGVEAVAGATYGLCEFLDVHRPDALDADAGGERVAYHGHCNQKALNRDHHAGAVLSRAGYDVETLDSTCCGMAGSFGYEAEQYDLSMAIGERLFEQVRETGAEPVAPGASCRTQLSDWEEQNGRVAHPVEKLAESL
ncbi:MAG: FAD-linked oxidase C-terminal domain-containing protein [Halolamina sp.]|uniref:FAD-binding and (Fe-S)-binding domain-containing protein n=1 Tax=Halolamina sp. TaxID=1940283 RepID=UPI002FC35337